MGIRKCYPFETGDVVISRLGDKRPCIVVSIDDILDSVVYKCLNTGTLFEASYLVFPTRYVKETP